MNKTYIKSIETVVVEVNGQTLDSVTFTSPDEAQAYKRNVRRWASARGVVAHVFTELSGVSRKEHGPASSPMPSLALT